MISVLEVKVVTNKTSRLSSFNEREKDSSIHSRVTETLAFVFISRQSVILKGNGK